MESNKLEKARLAANKLITAATHPKTRWLVYGTALLGTSLLFTACGRGPKLPVGLGTSH